MPERWREGQAGEAGCGGEEAVQSVSLHLHFPGPHGHGTVITLLFYLRKNKNEGLHYVKETQSSHEIQTVAVGQAFYPGQGGILSGAAWVTLCHSTCDLPDM